MRSNQHLAIRNCASTPPSEFFTITAVPHRSRQHCQRSEAAGYSHHRHLRRACGNNHQIGNCPLNSENNAILHCINCNDEHSASDHKKCENYNEKIKPILSDNDTETGKYLDVIIKPFSELIENQNIIMRELLKKLNNGS